MSRRLARLHSEVRYSRNDRKYLSGASSRAAFYARAFNRASRSEAKVMLRMGAVD
jgi:hypothetical protein